MRRDRSYRLCTLDRPYRLVAFLAMLGQLALGALLFGELARRAESLANLTTAPAPALAHTWAQVAGLALVGTVAFVAREWIRLRRLREQHRLEREPSAAVLVGKLSPREWRESWAVRTCLFAGVFLAMWAMQATFELWISGSTLHPLATVSSVPPISLLGFSLLVGAVVAWASMAGLRAFTLLEQLVRTALRHAHARASGIRLPARHLADVPGTIRDLFGSDQLSRPPPRGARKLFAYEAVVVTPAL